VVLIHEVIDVAMALLGPLTCFNGLVAGVITLSKNAEEKKPPLRTRKLQRQRFIPSLLVELPLTPSQSPYAYRRPCTICYTPLSHPHIVS
jgi:hypothetical protein